jgi:hypothetical protein
VSETAKSRADVLLDEFQTIHGCRPAVETADESAKLEAYDRAVDALEEDPPSALCLSGGGIRSATFALGVLQGLANWEILDRFHYLSTVSGGGYIGAWLSHWIAQAGCSSVMRSLATASGPKTAGVPEPAAVQQLRAFSSYLAPRRGISIDALSLLSIYFRNLVLNWLALVPLLLAVLMLPRLLLASLPVGQAVGGLGGVWLVAVGGALVAVAVSSATLIVHKPVPRRPAAGVVGTWFLWPLTIAAVLVAVGWPGVASHMKWSDRDMFLLCALGGVGVHLIGGLLALLRTGVTAGVPLVGQTLRQWLGILVSGLGGGSVLWAGNQWLFPSPLDAPGLYTLFVLPYLLTAYWLGTTVYMGFARAMMSEEDREWWARAGSWSLRLSIGWIVLAWIVLYGPDFFLSNASRVMGALAVGGASGFVAVLVGFWGDGGLVRKATSVSSWKVRLQDSLLPIAATAFIAFLALALSLGTSLVLGSSWFVSNSASETTGKAWRAAADSRGGALAARHAQETERMREFSRSATQQVEKARARTAVSMPSPKMDEASAAAEKAALAEALGEERRGTARRYLQQANSSVFGVDTHLESLARVHTLVARTHHHVSLLWLVGSAIILLTCGVMASRMIGVNRFSLHSMYGNRLIRAYLGASRPARQPDAYTGFDPGDNVPLASLRTPHNARLFHVINTALNLGRDCPLAWQQRRAAPFTMSMLHAGSPVTGYRSVEGYGGDQGGLSLGKSMTISGAAVNPAMGYHSSSPVAFAMTFFNARLGWWLPNPNGTANADSTWRRSEPKFGMAETFGNLLGLSDAQSRYVYLSDGGHFDNLGLYEMVARRCRRIFVVDASCDPNDRYEDLARVLRMIRVDFGVVIEFFAPSETTPTDEAPSFLVGRIWYPNGRHGLFVYLKPRLSTREPADVAEYAARRKRAGGAFPHDTTADQFFDESQFESYRILGRRTVEDLRRRYPSLDAMESADEIGTTVRTWLPGSVPPPLPPPSSGAETQRDGYATSGSGRVAGLAGMASANSMLWTVAASGLSAAVVTTALVTVSGTVSLQRPDPIPVAAPQHIQMQCAQAEDGKITCGQVIINSPPPQELTLHPNDASLLRSLSAAETGGFRINSADLRAVEKGLGLDLTDGARRTIADGISVKPPDRSLPVTVTVAGPTSIPLAYPPNGVPMASPPGGLPLNVPPRGLPVDDSQTSTQLKGVADALKGLDGRLKGLEKLDERLQALDRLRGDVKELQGTVSGIGPRRNVKGTQGTER